jgi:hypothetical protein
MTNRSVLLVLTIALAPTLWATSLWEQAVELYGTYSDLTPGRMEIRFDQYNGRGKLVTSEVSEIELWQNGDGELQTRVVSATRNGEDVTEKRRENPGSGAPPFGGSTDNDDDGAFAGLQRSPFDPSEQARVRTTDLGTTALVDGIRAREFSYVHTTGPDSATRGTAWISLDGGVPLRLYATIEPLPGFIDEFALRQRFDTDEQGRWILRELEFDGAGNVLFIRRRIESRLIFSEYFRSE